MFVTFLSADTFHAGHFFTGLTVVEVMLADEGPGDGGLCLVPGSHKVRRSPLPVPCASLAAACSGSL